MSLPRYKEYKESGSDWVGAVPRHWELVKLKHIAQFAGGGTPSRDNPSYWEGEFPWVSPKDMKSEIIDKTEEYITRLGLENSTAALIAPGAILMVVRSGILRHTIPVAINLVPLALNQDLKAIIFESTGCESRFFLRWVQGLNDSLLLEWGKQGATVESIEHEYLAQTEIPLPPLPEQRAIAAFLDRETAKIDALVAEQERLIALLAEKRRAVISHAVTKGLDPNAPMKDSGIAWLGEVPAHWEVIKLRHFARFGGGGTPNRENTSYWGGDIPWVSPKDMKSNVIRQTEEHITEAGLENSATSIILPGGVLMVVRSGILRHTIPIAINAVAVSLNQDMKAVRFEPETCEPAFFLRLVQGLNDSLLLAWGKQGATVESIEHDYLASSLIPLPPMREQAAIIAFLDREVSKLDTLMTEAERAIALLKERRSALISAAVTGKIDVRDAGETEEVAA